MFRQATLWHRIELSIDGEKDFLWKNLDLVRANLDRLRGLLIEIYFTKVGPYQSVPAAGMWRFQDLWGSFRRNGQNAEQILLEKIAHRNCKNTTGFEINLKNAADEEEEGEDWQDEFEEDISPEEVEDMKVEDYNEDTYADSEPKYMTYFQELLKLPRIEIIGANMQFSAAVWHVKSPTDIYTVPTEYLEKNYPQLLQHFLRCYWEHMEKRVVTFFEPNNFYFVRSSMFKQEYARVYQVTNTRH